ncbi:MAG: hypothetical protein FWD58_10300 [Firmicutes bacterium]|nr:hypothetical protein [Bacillota bacterium]
MKIYKIEVTDELSELIFRAAFAAGKSEEKFIADILSRFVFEPHIMESKDVAEGYAACGALNLEIANL